GQPKFLGGIRADIRDKQAEPTRRVLLQPEGRAELRLTAGATHEDHEIARNAKPKLRAVVAFNQGEGEVDARGHSCRRVEWRVSNEDRIRLELHLRMADEELIAEIPVRRCTPPV